MILFPFASCLSSKFLKIPQVKYIWFLAPSSSKGIYKLELINQRNCQRWKPQQLKRRAKVVSFTIYIYVEKECERRWWQLEVKQAIYDRRLLFATVAPLVAAASRTLTFDKTRPSSAACSAASYLLPSLFRPVQLPHNEPILKAKQSLPLLYIFYGEHTYSNR